MANTTYIVDSPKKGLITKITPKPSKNLTLPYKPEEVSMKKTKKVNRLGKMISVEASNNDNKLSNKSKKTYVI